MNKYTKMTVLALALSLLCGCVNTIGDPILLPSDSQTQPTDGSFPSSEPTTAPIESIPATEESEVPSDPETQPSEPVTDPSEGTAAPTTPSQAETTAPTVPSQPETTAPSESEPTRPSEPIGTDRKPGQLHGIYTRSELESMDTKVNGWGLGPHTDENNRPIDSIRAQDKYGKYEAYYIAPDDGKIYLTFDEGYENGYTAKILDVLKEKNVKAVFFITMQYAKSDPELVQRMIDEGHVVGNHSVKHKSMPTLSLDKMIEEVTVLHDYMLEHFGYEMTLFRPPMGEYSQQSLAVLQELGYKSVMWSFAHYDYDPEDQPSHEKTYNKIVDAAHGGAIYLLHAVSESNTAVLGDVIDQFRAQGFELALFQ